MCGHDVLSLLLALKLNLTQVTLFGFVTGKEEASC